MSISYIRPDNTIIKSTGLVSKRVEVGINDKDHVIAKVSVKLFGYELFGKTYDLSIKKNRESFNHKLELMHLKKSDNEKIESAIHDDLRYVLGVKDNITSVENLFKTDEDAEPSSQFEGYTDFSKTPKFQALLKDKATILLLTTKLRAWIEEPAKDWIGEREKQSAKTLFDDVLKRLEDNIDKEDLTGKNLEELFNILHDYSNNPDNILVIEIVRRFGELPQPKEPNKATATNFENALKMVILRQISDENFVPGETPIPALAFLGKYNDSQLLLDLRQIAAGRISDLRIRDRSSNKTDTLAQGSFGQSSNVTPPASQTVVKLTPSEKNERLRLESFLKRTAELAKTPISPSVSSSSSASSSSSSTTISAQAPAAAAKEPTDVRSELRQNPTLAKNVLTACMKYADDELPGATDLNLILFSVVNPETLGVDLDKIIDQLKEIAKKEGKTSRDVTQKKLAGEILAFLGEAPPPVSTKLLDGVRNHTKKMIKEAVLKGYSPSEKFPEVQFFKKYFGGSDIWETLVKEVRDEFDSVNRLKGSEPFPKFSKRGSMSAWLEGNGVAGKDIEDMVKIIRQYDYYNEFLTKLDKGVDGEV